MGEKEKEVIILDTEEKLLERFGKPKEINASYTINKGDVDEEIYESMFFEIEHPAEDIKPKKLKLK